MNNLQTIVGDFRGLLIQYGLADAIGGVAVLDEGLREMADRALPLVAELVNLDRCGDSLAEAVFDGFRYPHLTWWHGFLGDVLRMEMPAEMDRWMNKVFDLGPLAGSAALHAEMARLAYSYGEQGAPALLARFALFEALVLNGRVLMLASDVHFDEFGGSGRDVERKAEVEMEYARHQYAYRDELVALDDPLRVMVAALVANLDRHGDQLREQLRSVAEDVRRQLVAFRTIREIANALDPCDAVLLFNQGSVGDEQLSVEQLQLHHPLLLGDIEPNSVTKRSNRAIEKAARVARGEKVRRAGPSLAELLVERIRGEFGE